MTFDQARYPLTDRASPAYRELVDGSREALERWNSVRLKDFVLPEALEAMRAEANNLAPRATFQEGSFNPYFSPPPTTPAENDEEAEHPRRRLYPRRHGMIRGDHFSREGAIWKLFQDPDLCRFVADCLGYDQLFPYRDPYGCVNVNVQPPGSEFAWHYDHNDFTVSIGLTQPAEGGVFEYVPDLRSKEDENYPAVRAVLDGDRSAVRAFALRPGDLQLFRGGYSLHRVTAAQGERRMSLLLSYSTDPDHIASPEYAKRLWGEVHPLQLSEAEQMVR